MLSQIPGLLVSFATPANTVVDQEFTPPVNFVRLDTQIGVPSHFAGAQTFTPGFSGTLDSVEFWVQQIGTLPADTHLRLELRPTTVQGTPAATALGGVTFTPAEVAGPDIYKKFSLADENIWLNAGEKYALVFQTDTYSSTSSGGFDFRGHAASQLGGPYNYPGGQGFLTEDGTAWNDYAGPDFDYVFRTHMTVPEPGPATLFLLAAFLVRCLKFNRRG